MSEPQGLILFEGINDILEASFSLTQGISPGVATLVIPPQKAFKGLTGTLTIRQKGVVAKFAKCRVDEIEQLVDPQGREVWIVRVLDRRWLWRKCGRISGHYNYVRGTKIFNAKRPRELAKLCLEAMNEKGGDVKALPDDTFPEIEWDYTNPSEALASLCDALDCRVVLGVDDKVRIVKVNKGRPLRPNGRTLDGGKSIDPADPPGFIAIVGAPTRYQVDFRLVAVGLEKDGSVVPIDRLSYAPKINGRTTWRFSSFQDFQEITDLENRKLAQRSVFRWYQITNGPHDLPLKKDKVESWRILPLLNRQVETEKTAAGDVVEKPSQVYGIFWSGYETYESDLTVVKRDLERFPRAEFTQGFSVDLERGIVMLNSPAVRCEFGDIIVPGEPRIVSRQILPATLYLRTSVTLIDEKTRGIERVEWRAKPKGKKKADPKTTQYIIHEDTGFRVYRDAVGVVRDNRKEAAKAARHYLDIEVAKYETKDGGGLTQAGLLKEDVDGAIVQVGWSVSGDGRCSTRISRTKEDLSPSGDFKTRRLFERIDRALKDREKRARA